MIYGTKQKAIYVKCGKVWAPFEIGQSNSHLHGVASCNITAVAIAAIFDQCIWWKHGERRAKGERREKKLETKQQSKWKIRNLMDFFFYFNLSPAALWNIFIQRVHLYTRESLQYEQF